MCGIAGWIDFEQDLIERAGIMENMTATLKLRGPDSGGIYTTRHVLLGHRRLAVVDPEGGGQPMKKTVDGREYVLVYNGELYNTEELRNELLRRGYTFESYSDTEVLLTAYICWGEECITKLNGIFAFAVLDAASQKVFLARDPLGVKPLYYARRGSAFIFASELKALFAHPQIEPVIDRQGIAEVFAIGPATVPGSGTFKDVHDVPPATFVTVSREEIRIKEYWKPSVQDYGETQEEAVEHLRGLIVDAIKRQLVGDVPVCTFLSGGLDSSLISAVAAEEFRSRGRQLTTYSVDYEGNDQFFKASLFQPTSDQQYALQMAREIGSQHKTVLISQPGLADALSDAVIARDMPGMADVDSSLFLFCKEIRKNFVVALSGECADEIFGGYPWYTHEDMIYADTFPWSRFVGERQAVLSDSLSGLNLEEIARAHYLKTLSQVPHADGEDKLSYRMRELFYLNIKWFMLTLLNRKDRMSMSNSLEVRVPFADYRIVQYAFNIPPKIKFANGREKGLLRLAADGILPHEIAMRKKSPYPKTHNPEYTDIMCSRVDKILKEGKSPLLEIINKNKVREIVDTRGQAYKTPWFGQLMTGPQLLAYLLQLDTWLGRYKVKLDI